MADDWFKLNMDIFSNRKIKYLRRLPNGDSIVLFWIALIAEARRCNSDGKIFLTESIPYTTDMLAEEFKFEESTVQAALDVFIKLDMISKSNGFITIAGWEDHQNAEGLAKIREQNRVRQQRRRENQKQALIGNGSICEYCGQEGNTIDHIIPKTNGGLDVPENTVCSCLNCNMRKTSRGIDVFLNEMIATDNSFDVSRILANSKIMRFVMYDGKCFLSRDVTLQVTQGHAIDKEKEEEKEKELYISIVSYLNEKAGTKYKPTTAKTKSAINARIADGFKVEDFKTVIDKKCAEWLNDAKMAKYLRPETLFGTKFEGYLNQKEGKEAHGQATGNNIPVRKYGNII